MKLFLKILGGFVVLIVVFLIALSFYLTDERLKEIIMPRLNEMSGREIQVERISYTLFRTFPSFGLVIEKLDVPDTDPQARDGEPRRTIEGQNNDGPRSLASVDEILVSVDLIPLISGNVNVSRLDVNTPYFNYVIYEDGRTNLDSLIEFMEADEDVAETEATTQIDLQSIRVRNGSISYNDHSTRTYVVMRGFESDISLSYGELLTTDVDASVEALSVTYEGDQLIANLPVSLSQRSVVDMENERVTIESGRLNIRGLDLDMEGEVAEWGSDALFMDLRINSSSDDFAALLEMVPDEYKEDLEGVTTRGSLVLNATINGRLGEDQIPDFDLELGVDDGFIQYPNVDSPIEDINIRIVANNSIATIETFRAKADINSLEVSGVINNPLEDDADFRLGFNMDLDLGTIRNFYPLDDMELSGKMQMSGNALGVLNDAENAEFSARVQLENGYVKYVDLEEPIRDMFVTLNATEQRVDIESFSARAAENTLSLSGNITNPLDEERTTFDLTANIFMDLASIPKFYPIDEDTLSMRGEFRFDGTASGRLADVENANVNGDMSLANGYISYHELPRALEEIAFDARLTRDRIQVRSSRVKTGGNNFTANGDINDYLADQPRLNMNITGEFNVAEITDYVEIGPYLSEVSGKANVDLRVQGPPMTPENLSFVGLFRMNDFNAAGDSLPQPIRDLNANMVFSQAHVELRQFTMNMGESDFSFAGELRNYMRLIDENTSELATLNATFTSNKLNVDEIYEYVPPPEDEEPVPFPIELPKLAMNMEIEIGELIFVGVPITNISGTLATTDREIRINNAVAQMFDGSASGNVIWEVPEPENTRITFNGSLEGVQMEEFFEQVKPAGLDDLHQYFSGRFSADIEYVSDMDVFLDPVIPSIVSAGTFSMEQARMRNHPTQVRAADLLRTPEIRDLRLDDLNSSFTIGNSVMTLTDFNLTSREIGLELNGTQHLENEEIRYSAVVVLPGNLANNLTPVITQEGVNALKREDGKVPIPLRIRGTTESPSVGLDNDEIQSRIADYLRDQASDAVRNRLRNLFGN